MKRPDHIVSIGGRTPRPLCNCSACRARSNRREWFLVLLLVAIVAALLLSL